MRPKGEPPRNTRSAADDATRIIPIADNSIGQTQLVPEGGGEGSEGRGAIIGSSKRPDSRTDFQQHFRRGAGTNARRDRLPAE